MSRSQSNFRKALIASRGHDLLSIRIGETFNLDFKHRYYCHVNDRDLAAHD